MQELSMSAINRIANQFENMIRCLDEVSEEYTSRRVAPDKWSIHENMAHLARYQEVFLERVNAIVNGDEPSFERYIAEEDEGFKRWTTYSRSELLSQFRDGRKVLFRRLIALTPEEVQRTGRHPIYGSLNVPCWTEFFLLHESHHLFTTFRLICEINIDKNVFFASKGD